MDVFNNPSLNSMPSTLRDDLLLGDEDTDRVRYLFFGIAIICELLFPGCMHWSDRGGTQKPRKWHIDGACECVTTFRDMVYSIMARIGGVSLEHGQS